MKTLLRFGLFIGLISTLSLSSATAQTHSSVLQDEAKKVLHDLYAKKFKNRNAMENKLKMADTQIHDIEVHESSFLEDDDRLLFKLEEHTTLSLALEHYDQAIKSLKQSIVLETDPSSSAEYAKALALAYIAIGDKENGVRYFEMALDLANGQERILGKETRNLFHQCREL